MQNKWHLRANLLIHKGIKGENKFKLRPQMAVFWSLRVQRVVLWALLVVSWDREGLEGTDSQICYLFDSASPVHPFGASLGCCRSLRWSL